MIIFLLRLTTIFLLSITIIFASQKEIKKEDIKNWAQTYLNGLHAMVAKFTQYNPDGTMYHGKIWIRRGEGSKGKMRIDYKEGPQKKILALDDDLILFEKNGDMSTCPVSSTPAAYILRKKIIFDQDVFVKNIHLSKDKRHALIALGLEETEDDTSPGTLCIIFAISPTAQGLEHIVMWEVIDMQGNKTSVEIDTNSLHVNDKRLVGNMVFEMKKIR